MQIQRKKGSERITTEKILRVLRKGYSMNKQLIGFKRITYFDGHLICEFPKTRSPNL